MNKTEVRFWLDLEELVRYACSRGGHGDMGPGMVWFSWKDWSSLFRRGLGFSMGADRRAFERWIAVARKVCPNAISQRGEAVRVGGSVFYGIDHEAVKKKIESMFSESNDNDIEEEDGEWIL